MLGGVPITTDAALTDAEIRAKNLIIIGPASANSYLARIADRLPAQEKDGALLLGNEHYSLADRGYALFYVNPDAPTRFILVLSAPDLVKYPAALSRLFTAMFSAGPQGLALLDLTATGKKGSLYDPVDCLG